MAKEAVCVSRVAASVVAAVRRTTDDPIRIRPREKRSPATPPARDRSRAAAPWQARTTPSLPAEPVTCKTAKLSTTEEDRPPRWTRPGQPARNAGDDPPEDGGRPPFRKPGPQQG